MMIKATSTFKKTSFLEGVLLGWVQFTSFRLSYSLQKISNLLEP
jgi:hypothetical protein